MVAMNGWWVRLCAFGFGALVASSGCDKSGSGTGGLPVAESWQETDANAEANDGQPQHSKTQSAHSVGASNMANPHAGLDMANPHAGLDMGGGDPHAGLDMGGGDPHAGVDMRGASGEPLANLPPPDPNRAIDKSKFLRGTIRIAPALAKTVKKGSVIYLHARPVDPLTGDAIGSPIAVDRIDVDGFPITFALDGSNAMSAGTGFDGDVVVIARFDQDEDAMTKTPGDIEGRLRTKIPARELLLTLNKML